MTFHHNQPTTDMCCPCCVLSLSLPLSHTHTHRCAVRVVFLQQNGKSLGRASGGRRTEPLSTAVERVC